jgi:hypothetical protein
MLLKPVAEQKDDLREAAKAFYNLTVGDAAVRISTSSAEKRDAIAAAGQRLRDALTAGLAASAPREVSEVIEAWRTSPLRSHDGRMFDAVLALAKVHHIDLAEPAYGKTDHTEKHTEDVSLEWEHPCPFRGEPTLTPIGKACPACGVHAEDDDEPATCGVKRTSGHCTCRDGYGHPPCPVHAAGVRVPDTNQGD